MTCLLLASLAFADIAPRVDAPMIDTSKPGLDHAAAPKAASCWCEPRHIATRMPEGRTVTQFVRMEPGVVGDSHGIWAVGDVSDWSLRVDGLYVMQPSVPAWVMTNRR